MTILGVRAPWFMTEVDVSAKCEDVKVTIQCRTDAQQACPTCGKPCPRYDKRRRFRSSPKCGKFGSYVRFECSSDSCHALESKLALLEGLKSELRSGRLHYIDSPP